MPGSLKYFVYTCDEINGGESFAIKLDESNTIAVNGSDGDYTGSPSLLYEIPRNLRPRVANYINAIRRISIVILDPATEVPSTIPDPVVSGDGTMSLLSIRGERLRRPIAADTGQDDGTTV
jgi:hypothetical protein